MISARSLVLLAALTFASSDALAAGLDVKTWLERPGVKLLAVEFYATWCKPCMAAVPRWKALHEKYRDRGLRLVVVSTRDPEGSCANPGWNPDDIICDDEGTLADRFEASTLPAAFLWSWQGRLLVRRQHVGEVEAAVESWLAQAPRVQVAVEGAKESELEALVRSRLQDQDKLTVIATEAERKALAEIVRRSYEPGNDDKLQCEVGKDLSANSLLKATITKQRLSLSLLSAERKCLIASSMVSYTPARASSAVAEGIAELLAKLRVDPELPWMRSNAERTERTEPAEPKNLVPSQNVEVASTEKRDCRAPRTATTEPPPPRVFSEQFRASSVIEGELAVIGRLSATLPPSSSARPKVLRRLADAQIELMFAERGAKNETRSKQALAKAIETLSALTRDHPAYPESDEVSFRLAALYELAGDYRNARTSYYELIKKFPQSKRIPDTYLAFGNLFYQEASADSSKWPLVIQAYQEVVKYPPPANKVYGFASYRLGRALTMTGECAKALNSYLKAIDHGELAAFARQEIPAVFAGCGVPEKAYDFFTRVAPDPGQRGALLEELARAYDGCGKPNDAAIVRARLR